MQWRFVAVFDHQGHAMPARRFHQFRPMDAGVAHLQRMLQPRAIQLPGQLCHEGIQRRGIGRVMRVELPEQRAQPVAQRDGRLQERAGRLDRGRQVATLHQMTRGLH